MRTASYITLVIAGALLSNDSGIMQIKIDYEYNKSMFCFYLDKNYKSNPLNKDNEQVVDHISTLFFHDCLLWKDLLP